MSSYDMSRKTRHYYLITWQWATPVQQWMTAGDGGSPEKKQKLDQKLGQSADDVGEFLNDSLIDFFLK